MLVDSYGRTINYLRISVTQRCNFRCRYCMPTTPFEWSPKENILSYEDLFAFIKVAIDEGVEKIRITGGEPLIRHDIDKFIAMINSYAPNIDLAMTTNGYLLKKYAKLLKDAGLKRINMSLDSLKPEIAKNISQKDILSNVLEGLNLALEVGLKVKINTVVLRGINEDEIIDLLEFCKEKNCMIRYIEYMENTHAHNEISGLKSDEILNVIKSKYNIIDSKKAENSPSTLYTLDNGYKFGLIAPHKHDFCDTCNRLRLSAEGLLIPCLYFDEALSIKKAVEKGDIKQATEILKEVIRNKPEKNKWENSDENEISNRAFYETGG